MAIDDKDTTDLSVAPVVGPDDPRRFTDSGIEVEPVYRPEDLPAHLDLGRRVPVHARDRRASRSLATRRSSFARTLLSSSST